MPPAVLPERGDARPSPAQEPVQPAVIIAKPAATGKARPDHRQAMGEFTRKPAQGRSPFRIAGKQLDRLRRTGDAPTDRLQVRADMGRVAEWSIAPVLKTGDVQASVGSNPTPSANRP